MRTDIVSMQSYVVAGRGEDLLKNVIYLFGAGGAGSNQINKKERRGQNVSAHVNSQESKEITLRTSLAPFIRREAQPDKNRVIALLIICLAAMAASPKHC